MRSAPGNSLREFIEQEICALAGGDGIGNTIGACLRDDPVASITADAILIVSDWEGI